jgi:hypothetical protein
MSAIGAKLPGVLISNFVPSASPHHEPEQRAAATIRCCCVNDRSATFDPVTSPPAIEPGLQVVPWSLR